MIGAFVCWRHAMMGQIVAWERRDVGRARGATGVFAGDPSRLTDWGMLMIGLTGGIGAGKSAVAKRLGELGAVVIDSDLLAREVVRPGTPGLSEVVAAFGDGVLAPDGTLDRPGLGRIVFGDDEKRRRLERIVHPLVRARADAIVAAAPADAVIVNDVPLLVEAGLAGTYDLVIVVFASTATRLGRLLRERGMPQEEARSRMAAQASDDQRRAVADVVITNDGTLDQLCSAVDDAWREQILPRLGRSGHESGQPGEAGQPGSESGRAGSESGQPGSESGQERATRDGR